MKILKPAILMTLFFMLLCGGIYPVVVTGVSQALFPRQAGGSMVTDRHGEEIGSLLIGQAFSATRYFWPRPSATADFAYNPMASGGSNAGPTNPEYLRIVAERVAALRAGGMIGPIPSELVQSSASGLDPHISPEAARLQARRVATARRMRESQLLDLIAAQTEGPQLGIFGAPRVNLLALNLELDRLQP